MWSDNQGTLCSEAASPSSQHERVRQAGNVDCATKKVWPTLLNTDTISDHFSELNQQENVRRKY